VLSILGGGLFYLFRTAGAVYQLDGVPVVAAVGIVGGIATVVLAVRRQVFASGVALASAFAVLSWVFVLQTLPSFEVYKPVPPLAARIQQLGGDDALVASYDQAIPSLVFYLRRHVEELHDPEALLTLMGGSRRAFAVMSESDYVQLRPSLPPQSACLIGRQPTFDVKLKNVLAREALPALVLVWNRCLEAPISGLASEASRGQPPGRF
jgi:hypothetical protein